MVMSLESCGSEGMARCRARRTMKNQILFFCFEPFGKHLFPSIGKNACGLVLARLACIMPLSSLADKSGFG